MPQPPVYYRRQWYTGQGDKIGYYFILTKADERDLIVVAESERVKQFLELQRLKVIAALTLQLLQRPAHRGGR